MAGLLTVSQLPNAIDRRVKKHFLETYPTVEPKLEKIFKIDTQEDFNEYEQDYQGLGRYQPTAEGETYKQDNFAEAYQTVYTPSKLTKSVPISMESQMWDKAMITKAENVGTEMAKAAADTIEADAASVFINGFNTSYTSYGDSKPLFSTDHTRPDGGTSSSNASGSSMPLSPETLESAMTAFRAQKGKRGRLIGTVPRVLLVPPALEAEAKRITGSNQLSKHQRPGTNDNDANVFMMRDYYGGNIGVVVWEYLGSAMGGSDTAWFLLDTNLHKITWKWAKKPSVRKDETTGIQNDTIFFLGMYYASFGWSDWVGTYGSKGDSSTYTS